MRFIRKPFRFALLYSVFLALAVTLVLLDTFVLPSGLAQVQQSDQSGTAGSETSSAGTGTYTDNSYKDDSMSVTLKETDEYDTHIYIVDIQLSDISQLKTALAENTYGRNIKETTSEMAEAHDAILAINGDYYGFRNRGYVLRNGELYRDTSNGNEDLAILADGTFQIVDEDEVSAASLQEEGALQVFSFGPALMSNGKIKVSENTEVEQAKTSNPRTAIGMISPLHYVIIVSDGRSSESQGLSLYQLAQLFQKEGCTVAYNLDGGGSTTLWFHGSVVNQPTDGRKEGEREVSDIVYLGYS